MNIYFCVDIGAYYHNIKLSK